MSLALAALVVPLGLYFAIPRLLRVLIRRLLRNYINTVVAPPGDGPLKTDSAPSVAVVGAGIAGLVSALVLARRGFRVVLFEKNSYLGGKLGSWRAQLKDGRTVFQSHGFHAFFRHYHNLNRFLDSVDAEKGGLRREFRSIGEYMILGRDGGRVSFDDRERTPIFNLFGLLKSGVFTLRDALLPPGRDLYGIFLEYEPEKTAQRYDHLSFGEFSRLAQVPPRLKTAFNTFARAFFSDEDRLSFAELVKSFHFYYLSHDGGLTYDYPTRDYEAALLAPILTEFTALGGELRLSTPIESLEFKPSSGDFALNGENFENVVLSADVVGVRSMMTHSSGFPDALRTSLSSVRSGQRYSVLRLWLDQDVREGIPVFVITERKRVLDSVTLYHRFEQETQEDLGRSGAQSVLELHSYATPDDLPSEKIEAAFLEELREFFPELQTAKVLDALLQVRDDFTAFHVGLDASRPSVQTGVPGFVCAGDWVKLPFPAMLLECAAASAYVAVNEILQRYNLATEPIYSVPLRGILAGIPEAKARHILRP